MAQVTVCVPAYRAASFLDQTLASIQGQTFDDYVVEVALEPPEAEATVSACRAFRDDSRFRFRTNERTLGWDGNIRRLLGLVETPYFAILPHDDLWHPQYLEALMLRLADRPEASVAYADIFLFGKRSGVRSLPLPDAELAERLTSFFLGGAEALPWRGVVRASLLDRAFPGNRFSGFGVECEWALHIIGQGPAIHVAHALYLKRARADDDGVSAGWRFRMPADDLLSALEHHRAQLLAGIGAMALEQPQRRAIEFAAEAAMLRRWVAFTGGRFSLDSAARRRVDAVVASCRESDDPLLRSILGRIHLALSVHAASRGDPDTALEEARRAARLAPDHWETLAQLARLLASGGHALAALPVLYQAARLAPMGLGMRDLEERCAAGLDAMYPFEPVRLP